MRYISDRVISFSLAVNGVDRRIRFIPLTKGGSIYITDNKDEMKELEKSTMYGSVYKRSEMQAEKDCDNINSGKRRKTSGKQKIQSVNGVDSWQEAIEYMVDKHGADRNVMSTPEEILKEAERLNLCFPNIG